ncbi:mitochondrial chaperone bcs1 protein [Rutstroemia sp. NJR-2017a BVV2]|nr:mitochondrial chaperone bcs1 protein [Rutstroemia sp. NJR-2017a BVV2]
MATMNNTEPVSPMGPGNTQGFNTQYHIIDSFFPGFSLYSSALLRYTGVDLNIYIPALLIVGILMFAWQYISTWFWIELDEYFMSSADIRIDDEMYNMLMAWVSKQSFAQGSRRFVANTNLNSRMWNLWSYDEDNEEEKDEEEIDFDENGNPVIKKGSEKKDKKVLFTPSFGTHYFWYKRRLLQFRRTQNYSQGAAAAVSEREEITISSFGRNPQILKELLEECRVNFLKNDENKTIIYRGGMKSGGYSDGWTRCVSRVSRPFSTVILDEQVKQNLLEDIKDYLHPSTRRWYSNRGIPYRRGYLLYGPPGTGKSSLSFAIAGYFKLKIYIVSLNSSSTTEDTLTSLFAELPKQCVVLLEDIDTAGLTHTRDDDIDFGGDDDNDEAPSSPLTAATKTLQKLASKGNPAKEGKISLSALLNVIDGVASQEGRILIMTTNHIEKLDEALIRPGRVDMSIHFDLASRENIEMIFKSIYATLEGDYPDVSDSVSESGSSGRGRSPASSTGSVDSTKSRRGFHHKPPRTTSRDRRAKENLRRIIEAEEEQKRIDEEERVAKLAVEFSKRVPEGKFSPAEIQGYLLKHKRSAEAAVEGAEAWAKERHEEKERAKLKEKEDEKRREKEKEKLEKQIEKLKKEKEEMEGGNDKDEEEGKEEDGEDDDAKDGKTKEATLEVEKLRVDVMGETEALEKRVEEIGGKLKGIEMAKAEKGTVDMIEYAESASQTEAAAAKDVCV